VCEAQGRVLKLPAAGRYRIADLTLFGSDLGGGRRGMARYAAIQEASSGHLYLDTNGDLDFSHERRLTDFNARDWDQPSIVSLVYPGSEPVNAVVSLDASGTFVWLHPFTASHATMTSSVAAGSDVETNFAVGVAPNASLVFADSGPRARLLSHALEGLITLARDKDVDVLYGSVAVQTPLGTTESFDSAAFDRISDAYDKPILTSAGNYMAPLSSSPAPGGRVAMTVGQYISPKTTKALFGLERLDGPVYASTVGPAFDGDARPTFIAASRRPSAVPCGSPRSDPGQTQFQRPPCLGISGGTSAASPSAAGAVALLLSAAKQRHMKVSVRDLRDALIASAQPVAGIPPHMQGAGLIDVPRAWRHLQRRSRVLPLDVEGELRHRFVDLLGGVRARGLLWVAGSQDKQTMSVGLSDLRPTVESVVVRVEGSLMVSVPANVSLDPGAATRVPVTVTPPAIGRIASAWITFFKAPGGETLARVLATAARPARLTAPRYEYAWTDDVDYESHNDTLVSIPPGATGMLVEAHLIRGDGVPIVVNPWSLPLLPRAYWSGGPFFSTPVNSAPGRYAGVLLDPDAGDWGVTNLERSTVRSAFWAASQHPPERFSIGMRVIGFRTECRLADRTGDQGDEHIRVSVRDAFAAPVDGGVLAAPAAIETSRFTLEDEFERRPVSIDVQPGTAAFHVEARQHGGDGIMLQLFDCTQGHCLSEIQSAPGETSPAVNVRQPRAGPWKIFAVPIRPLSGSTPIEITVSQMMTADVRRLEPVGQTTVSRNRRDWTIFEGEIPRRDRAGGVMIFRTDARAAIAPEGWGAVSSCVMPKSTQSSAQ